VFKFKKMSLTVKAKLLGGFGLVLLLMVAMGSIAYYLNTQVEEANNEAILQMEEIISAGEKEVAHLDWLNELADALLLQQEFTGELDHALCDLGEWYYATENSEEFRMMSQEFQEIFMGLDRPHEMLHGSAAEIVEISERLGLNSEEGREQALQVYHNETRVYLAEVRNSLHEMTDYLQREKEYNIAAAHQQGGMSRQIVIVASIAGLIIGITLALLIIRGITVPIKALKDSVWKLAEGDFTTKVDIRSRDEIGQMAANLNKTIDVLSETLGRVQETSDNVSHASAEISSGNQDLSQRTEEQASSLEEVSSTIEEMSSSLETSSANAAEADNLSGGTLDSVRQGETVVKDMQGAMTEITRGSQEISEIISTVNDIAFQTNLLALNAAVEAARAGEQGRGFAVVAAEVRNLAGRSAESAKEIEKLIKDSIVRVEKGNTLMNDTEKVLQEIVANTQKTSDVVGEIASSLREQSTASGEIRNAIEELNQVTQQNASLVEEIASSSENMNSEAQELAEKVSFFKISENGVKKSNKQPSKEKLDKQNYNNEYAQTEERARVKKDLQAVAAAPLGNGPQFREEDFEKF